ncbi:DUF3159 domain-containing protein [Actinomadura rupiterrae]|uniref:DUF3159 domain-containing protein n=1 Tax=Actinomadura rupiterrae TaxID=559627 RepID=UPI0020A49074|nr:DUF3159 domain-containing protein [Actinomadura rupiterrae]MCP2342129.1 hypothetical protein [Actinomadura rupiterrae]
MTTMPDNDRPGTASQRPRYSMSLREAARAAFRPGGHASSLVTTAAPTLVFVLAAAVGGLRSALIATAVSAVLVLAWRLRSRSHLAHATIGTLLAVVCAAVAAGTGQARTFFLLPMLLPAAAATACLLSVLAGRPLAGLVANRIVGGPRDWRTHRRLHRFYRRTTLAISLVSLASLAAQVVLYRLDAIAGLGVLHVLMAPMWAGVTAGSVVLSRLAVTRYRDAPTS